jgi:drug/metabolite transporter (DMT)-like permease
MQFIGELAALATSFFFAMTALIFTKPGLMVGSQVTNRTRLTVALIYLVILNLILFREPLPFSAESSRWIWLSLSGVIGISLGDAFLFQSLVSVGPRLGSLLLSLAPIFGSIIAWIFFGEVLTPWQITGIVLALTGIAWVVMSHEEPPDTPRGHTSRGVLFGVLAALGQAWDWSFRSRACSGSSRLSRQTPSVCWQRSSLSGHGRCSKAKQKQRSQRCAKSPGLSL